MKFLAVLSRCCLLLALGIVVTLGASAPGYAVDLTGKTLLAHGDQVITRYNMSKESVTWDLEIYFGNAGNRFVLFTKRNAVGTTNFRNSFARVLIPAGENRGLKRRKDGKFTLDVRLEQSAGALKVNILSRGKDTGFANEAFIYVMALGNSSCDLQAYRYIPDAGLQFNGVRTTPAGCTITNGAPEGLNDK